MIRKAEKFSFCKGEQSIRTVLLVLIRKYYFFKGFLRIHIRRR